MCAGCPVRTECLAEALDNQIEWGVWGGMTERERRALLRRRPNVTSWRRLLETAMLDHVAAVSASTAGARAGLTFASLRSGRVAAPGAQGQEPGESSLADRRRPSRSCTSLGERGHDGRRHRGVRRIEAEEQPRLGHEVRRAVGVEPEQPGRRAVRAGFSEPLGRLRACSTASRGPRSRLARFSTRPGERHPVLVEPLDEVGGLAQGVRLGRGHHEERRPSAWSRA